MAAFKRQGWMMKRLGGRLAAWTGVSGLSEELQLACVPPNLTNANFSNGDLFFFTDTPGQIGWLSADGTRSNLNWLTLTGESSSSGGNLCFGTTAAPSKQANVNNVDPFKTAFFGVEFSGKHRCQTAAIGALAP
jgi:hypothetical protein